MSTSAPQILPSPPRQKKRPIWIVAGILIVAVGALAAWYWAGSVSHDVQVVAVAKNVPKGAQVAAADLVIVSSANDPHVSTVPAANLPNVVGKLAAADLQAGALLSPAGVTSALTPAAGTSIVGMALAPGQLPTSGLAAGDKVRAVFTPKTQEDLPPGVPSTIAATVFAIRQAADGSASYVDLSVPSGQAVTLTQIVATGRVALIFDNQE